MKYVSRSDWGAKYGRGPTNITPQRGGVAIHWEGPKMGTFPHSSCDDKVRGIERFHVQSNGWDGIAYTLLVCPHGYVFEGRGLGRRTAANGTNDSNQRYYAICALIGKGDAVPEALLDGMRDGVAYLRDHDAGNDVKPHSAFFSTECPGDRLRKWISGGTGGGDGGGGGGGGKAPAWPGVYLKHPPPTEHSSARTWQSRMRQRGWTISVDGVYGPQSKEVCIKFQREKGLDADGIVGPATWKATWTSPVT
ncbi:MAG: peptidoglycan-binding domain-containing protein [Streptosporangiales bacterium]|nr:peptidoglycan-binding domain-containing protein [Streptosporangiales bacterium]